VTVATKRKAVFLDRDGVLIRSLVRGGTPYPPSCRAEVELLPGTGPACRLLREAGFVLVLVTNQPDVARGNVALEWVEQINAELKVSLGIHSVKVCIHDDREGCFCRKPKPGLLLEAAQELNIEFSRSFMVGDRWKDVEAGRRAGCSTVWISNGYQERLGTDADWIARDLAEAAPLIVRVSHEWEEGAI
jgi:D-glycero-D-manno-heptose 1,7-bisphosphate phosphatase